MKWKCKCECGGEITATTLALKAGIITSCGCTAADEVTLDLANIDRGNIEGTSTIALQGTLDGVMYENNNSGVRGVYYSNTYHCYWATIVFKGKNHFLGGYKALEDAARARRQAEDILYSAFMDHYKEDLEPQVEAETERDKKDRFADFVENLETTSEERIAVVIPGKYEEGFCQVCGKKIPKQSRGRKKYCSDSCLGLAKKRKTVRTGNAHHKQIICPDCGKIAWVGYRSIRCKECQAEVRKRQDLESKERAKENKTRKIGQEALCERCGRPYIVRGATQKYCDNCQGIMLQEKAQERRMQQGSIKKRSNADL